MTNIVCLSKNRPFQLKETLRTIRKFFDGEFSLQVLFDCTDPYEERYSRLSSMFSEVDFIRQRNFFDDFLRCIKSKYTMFVVDDALIYNRVNLPECELAANDSPVHLRLHPSCRYCQPASLYEEVPYLEPFGKTLLKYQRSKQFNDWNYVFDLSGSLYRSSSVLEMIDLVRSNSHLWGEPHLNNPNALEGNVNLVLAKRSCGSLMTGHSFCSAVKTLSVITVNNVSDYKSNKIYPCRYSLSDMNMLFDDMKELDESFYAAQEYNSIHIGDFVLKGAAK